MSDKTNDEKLRILQERLAQIKQKQDTPVPQIQQRVEVIEVATTETGIPKKEKKTISLGWLKYVIIIGGVGYGAFYTYTNFDLSSSDFLVYKLKIGGLSLYYSTS